MKKRPEVRAGSRQWRRQRAYDILPLVAPLARWSITGLSRSLRVSVSGEEPVRELRNTGRPHVLAFFHGRQFLLVNHLRGLPITIMTSISYMGELQTLVLEGLGYTVVRGSSSRGGTRVLARTVGEVRQGKTAAFAVDGPRGPHQVVKPGVLFVARKLGIPVVPVSTSSSPSLHFASAWDRYILPLPFARAHVAFGEPYIPGDGGGPWTEDAQCRKLAGILMDLEREADLAVGRT